ncbi:MAG: LysR family transcriptional regulator, partial [Brevundimonas sp.]
LDADAQIAALRQGIGLSRLPCFVGDADPLLARAPGVAPKTASTLWILTHGDTRRTKRVRLFVEFMSARLAAHAALFAGLAAPEAG